MRKQFVAMCCLLANFPPAPGHELLGRLTLLLERRAGPDHGLAGGALLREQPRAGPTLYGVFLNK